MALLLDVVCGWRPLCLLLVLVVIYPIRGFEFGKDFALESCCYGDSVVDHGHVAVNLPSCCRRLVCHDGRIVNQDVFDAGDQRCCEFDGLLYEDGTQLAAQCIALECKRGRWTVPEPIDDCCKHCQLYNDPHITTFDGFHYDWHGTCNYSVAQSGFGADPDVGVFSDFVSCNGDASCLDHTTFRDNPHTVISMTSDNVHLLNVNGDEFVIPDVGVHAVRSSHGRHPVLAWQEGNCVFLLGSSKLVLQHCRHRLDVWAYPSHTKNLNGLCGYLNSYIHDDFTDRRWAVHALHARPRAFPESWRTREQSDHRCDLSCVHCYEETTEDPCRASPNERALYSRRCRKLLHPIVGRDTQLMYYVINCAFDVCMMRQNGASDEDVDEWLVQMQILLQQKKIILARTHDGKRPNTDPLPDDDKCISGSHFKIDCNWCNCENGITICTLIHCGPEYIHEFGEDACDDGSRWQVGNCNPCVCVRGGAVCSPLPCDDTGSPKPKLCFLDPDVGPCEAHIRRYAYNRLTKTCEKFFYGGCLGNDNNFETKQECLATCGKTGGGAPKPEQCLLEQDPGPCYGAFPRFSYNDETGQCELFIYGGCKGNENNFESLQECEELCKGHSGTGNHKQDICFLDIDAGPCLAHNDRYAYNRVTGKCEHFIYGGCLGNDNNFVTLEECREACGGFGDTGITKPGKCFQGKDPGPCKGKLKRFAYNHETEQCDMFYYGGCLGNDNNFLTLDECKEACSVLACPVPRCNVGCQITIDATTGCPTCSCIDCPEIKCPITCEVINDPRTDCPFCKCPCPAPLCPLDCTTRIVIDETGCEVCECDPHSHNRYPS